MTVNNTANPSAAPRPPSAMTDACRRHFSSATYSIIETLITNGQVRSLCTDTTEG